MDIGGWVFNLYFRSRHSLSAFLALERNLNLGSGGTVSGEHRVCLKPVQSPSLCKQDSYRKPQYRCGIWSEPALRVSPDHQRLPCLSSDVMTT